MPFREQEFRELCSACGDAASASCARCGRPLCAGHVHDDATRCAPCEGEFVAMVRRSGNLPAEWGKIAAACWPIVLLVVFATHLHGAAGFAVTLSVFVASIGAYLGAQRWAPRAANDDEAVILRRRFLRQGAERRLPRGARERERAALPAGPQT